VLNTTTICSHPSIVLSILYKIQKIKPRLTPQDPLMLVAQLHCSLTKICPPVSLLCFIKHFLCILLQLQQQPISVAALRSINASITTLATLFS
jgi:hypothetical protein